MFWKPRGESGLCQILLVGQMKSRVRFALLDLAVWRLWWERSKPQVGQIHKRKAGELLATVNTKSSSKIISHKGDREREN